MRHKDLRKNWLPGKGGDSKTLRALLKYGIVLNYTKGTKGGIVPKDMIKLMGVLERLYKTKRSAYC